MECYSIDRGNQELSMELIKKHKLKITVTPLGGKSRKPHRRVTYMTGLLPQSSAFQVDTVTGDYIHVPQVCYSNTLNNLLEAVVNRMFLVKYADGTMGPPPKAAPGKFDTLHPYIQALAGMLDDHLPFTIDEYVASSPAHRRKVYEVAGNNLKIQGMQPHWRDISVFVKFQRETGSAARAIAPPSPECIINEGIYIKSVEEKSGGQYTFYQAIDIKWSELGVELPTCSKGMTNPEWGQVVSQKWARFKSPVYISLDCSRFSQHTGLDALCLVEKFIKLIHPDMGDELNPRIQRLSTVYVPDEYGNTYKVNVQLPPMLFDGSPWTALVGHLIMNAVMWKYFQENPQHIETMDCGDDFGFICEEDEVPDMPRMQSFLLAYGYTLKIETEEPVSVINEIEFCKGKPIFVQDRWIMIRPLACLEKDSTLLCQASDHADRLFAVGMGGVHLNKGVPVYHNFYRALIRLSGVAKFKRKHLAFLYASNYAYYTVMLGGVDTTTLGALDYTPHDRYQFFLTTGVIPAYQEYVESIYDNITYGDVPGIWHMW